MIPLDVQLDRFLPLYDRKVTAHRALSVESDGAIDLIRPGAPWVERLASFQEWDDRGQAYALWRHVSESDLVLENNPFWAFVFDVLVEADAERVVASGEKGGKARQATLQRQGDALLAPQMVRVAVGPEGQIVSDEKLRAHLLRPFDRDTDANLHKERVEVLDVLVTHSWAERCRAARQTALSHVSEQANVQEAIGTAQRRLEFQRRQASYQRARREAHGLSADMELISLLDSLEASITSPRLYVDAVGFVALSNQFLWEAISPDVISVDA